MKIVQNLIEENIPGDELLEDYIDDYLRNEATEEEMDRINMTRHTHGRTYNQKRGRGRRWVR